MPGASRHCPRQAPVMPLVLVFTDVDTPVVHCQRHILVYHFVYLRPTQGAHEYSYAHGGYCIGAVELLSACDCYCIWGDTSEGGFRTLPTLKPNYGILNSVVCLPKEYCMNPIKSTYRQSI